MRGERSYSQVARECSTPEWTAYPGTIRDIEKGYHMLGAGLLARLAEAIGVTPNDLLSPPRQSQPRRNRP